MSWETVIGLEVHVQLACRSKIFSASSTAYGAPPNTQASLIDLGYPGVLPVLNREAVRMAVVFGLACSADIAPVSVFARKNYFYPDLPKGYQISQLDHPIVGRGALTIELPDGSSRTIGITRAHLEEDAGKSLHDALPGLSGIDLNRAGTPLLEIVSEPELRSATEAVAYLRKLRMLVRYLGISDGNMQEGSFRCDANVSVRRPGDGLGTRAEIKNLNSFRFIERAIDFEVERQIDLLESGRQVVQETRLYDEHKDETRSMRSKEEANDYRYFPDPDLLPVELSPEWIEQQRATLPELPDARRTRFERDYSQPADAAALLTSSRELADYFEDTVRMSGCDPRLAANWVTGELGAALNRDRIALADSRIDARRLGGLLARIEDGTISGKIAKEVFEAMWSGDDELDADRVIEQQGLRQISDAGQLAALVDQVVSTHPEQVEQYRGGKNQLIGFFVGKVMQASGGKANPKQVNALLRERLAD